MEFVNSTVTNENLARKITNQIYQLVGKKPPVSVEVRQGKIYKVTVKESWQKGGTTAEPIMEPVYEDRTREEEYDEEYMVEETHPETNETITVTKTRTKTRTITETVQVGERVAGYNYIPNYVAVSLTPEEMQKIRDAVAANYSNMVEV